MDKQIVFTEKNKAELLSVESAALLKGQVRVKTAFSTISNGTEKANFTGDPVVSIYSMPDDEAVFPRYLGYSASGVVVEVGEGVTSLKVGDRVAMYGSNHKNFIAIDEMRAIKIESDDVSLEEAAMAYIATFPLAAIRKTKLEIGEPALVMGLGILGLFGVGLLKCAGAVPVIAVDPVAERREKALAFGADYAFDPFAPDFAEQVKAVTGGVKVALEVTGAGAGLNEVLDCMAPFGRVALLGCTRNNDFTVDYYRKVHGPGISLIGAHSNARPQVDSHSGYFTIRDDIKTVLMLCAKNRFDLRALIAQTLRPKDCQEIYTRLANDANFPIISQFDWSEV